MLWYKQNIYVFSHSMIALISEEIKNLEFIIKHFGYMFVL